MSFDFALFLQTVLGLTPVIISLVPGGAALAPFVPILMRGISDVEQSLGVGTGPQKKAAVLDLVTQAATAANAVKPETVGNPDLLVQSAGVAIDAIITSINAVQEAHAVLPVTSPALATLAALPAA